MTSEHVNPPRWAHAVLRSIVRASDRDAISGDLLEEYRAVQHPTFGARRANAWYVRHVLSLLWRLVWPCACVMVALKLALVLVVPVPWSRGVVQAPGVSAVDAVISLVVGYYASQRTGVIRTGTCLAGVLNVLGVLLLLGSAVVRAPGLLVAPFAKPFIFVILLVLLSMPLGWGVAFGSIGGLIGRWWAPPTRRMA